jgi:imidazolonepropionase-like amidohydrolase
MLLTPSRRSIPPLGLAPRPAPATQNRAKLHGIKASLLIPGRGEPIKNGAVVIHEDIIDWVGPQSKIPAKYSAIPFAHVSYLMPGLWDCHVHYFGAGASDEGSGYAGLLSSAARAGARISKDLERTLLAGFTSVREVGGYGGEISGVVDEGTILGPNIYSSIAPISMTAGHGDIHNLPIDTVLDACAHGLPFAVCDGVPDCIKTVRLQIRKGAKLIKVCASGGVYSLLDSPQDSQFSPEELKAMVGEAARARRIVAAHCHAKEGIMNALHAGVKTIEHGSYLDEECVALMKEKDAIFVPTASVIEGGFEYLDELPPNTARKLREIASHSRKAYKLAIKSGVKIALGTDQAASVDGTYNSHGRNGKELFWAVNAGMTPLQAIEACTATSPETLGPHMAPKSGQLKEGYDADIIAVSGNPLENIDLLSEAANITHVWKGGKLYKSC